ncbi:MAG: hypothetical protein PHR92_11630 [Lachnospiraceae bacterium]|nr:hypothetical protein [Lachnospiraceae bacterium]
MKIILKKGLKPEERYDRMGADRRDAMVKGGVSLKMEGDKEK